MIYLFILFLLSETTAECSEGTYEVNGACYASCGDKILAGEEICDSGVGCERNCQCAEGWKGNKKISCLPEKDGLMVSFAFTIELDERPGYREGLFKSEVQTQIVNAYKNQFTKDNKLTEIKATNVVVKPYHRNHMKNTTIDVKFYVTGNKDQVPVYVEYFDKMIYDYDSEWYQFSSSLLRFTNTLKPVTVSYHVDAKEFNGASHLCIFLLLILLFLF